MGIFTKSLFILTIAISTPLIYRQFASDKTVKFMSTYYTNYKTVDQFLRQSASHLDQAKNYLPSSQQLEDSVGKLSNQIKSIVTTVRDKVTENVSALKEKTGGDSVVPAKKAASVRYVSCAGDNVDGKMQLWSKMDLAKFDGRSDEAKDTILLSFLGLVYNVTVNMQHYSPGAEYNAFAGKDATRAFVTGNFTHDLHDDVSDLDESFFSHLDSWQSFYSTSYPVVGRLEGNFFDTNGCPTKELKRVQSVIKRLNESRQSEKEREKDYPECNSEWNSELNQGRVWCTTKSGGVDREWVGVPRLFNGDSPRCACIKEDALNDPTLSRNIATYDGCKPEASECILKQ